MPHSLVARFLFVFALLCAAAGHRPAYAQDTPVKPAISPSQASQVLDILRDDKKRAALEQTLSVIAAASDGTQPAASPQADATAAAATAPAPAATPAPAPAATPTPAPPIALERNGVVAQVSRHVGVWLSSMATEMQHTALTMLQFRSIARWAHTHFGTAEMRSQAFNASWAVFAILAIAFAVEWLIWRALKRARTLIATHAAKRFAEQENRRAASLPVLSTPADGAPPLDGPATDLRAHDHHLHMLRRVPYALANAVVNLVPLAGFLAAAALLLAAWGGERAVFYDAAASLIGAYAAIRITLCVVCLLIAPGSQALRLTRLKNDTAQYLYRWTRRIVVTAVLGSALTDVALDVGATPDFRNVISKLIALVVHVMLIIVVIQTRHKVSRWIRHGKDGSDAGYSMRGLLADAWAFVAIFIIAALWIIWTLGVTNGFQQVLHYVALTVGVVLLASVVSILALGALDRAFFGDPHRADNEQASRPPHHYYHTLVQRSVSCLIMILAVFALLQVWGLDVWSWFQAGSVGRSVASAVLTIVVACALAIVAWESANFSIKRRVDTWTSAGDVARATRLRTLVPILRTSLFIVIALIVLLTALNELGINIAPLLAGASIIGVALGFGSQKLVQDFITGIFLLMENAMQVGDYVTVAGLGGSVEYLSIRTVKLRAGDGSLHVIPFSSVSTVTNTNRGIGNAAVSVRVRADADIDAVIAAIKSVGADMREDPRYKGLILADLDLWGVDQVDGATVTISGQIRTLDSGRWPVQRGFNQLILQRFRELGIQFANPQETLFLEKKLPSKPEPDTVGTPQTPNSPTPSTSNMSGASTAPIAPAGAAPAAQPPAQADK
jgi:small-conductance mechanosensitive channel